MLSRDKDFLKMLFAALFVVFILALNGCALTDTSSIELAGKAVDRIPQDVGRFSAWTAAVSAQEQTKQKQAEVELAEAQADKARAENTTVIADTPEKMAIASMLEMGKAMSKALVALAKKDEKQEAIPMPKGVVAESLESAGNAGEKILKTPTAVASAVGKTAVEVAGELAKKIGDKVEINGNENVVKTTKTDTTTINSTTGAESPVKVEQAAPVVEEEMVEEVIEEPVVEGVVE